jgi:hypothetical protein
MGLLLDGSDQVAGKSRWSVGQKTYVKVHPTDETPAMMKIKYRRHQAEST